jgi:hypothetical protein
MPKRRQTPGPVPVPPADAPAEVAPEEPLEAASEDGDSEPEPPDPQADASYTERPVKEGRGHHKEPSAGIFARMSEITKEDWEHYDIYLYRLAPIIDQSLAGKASFITKYRERIDEARVLSDFGSGGYRVCLNRLNDSGVSSNVFRADFNCLNYQFPPKVVPGTWVDDPRNAKWAWAKPKDPAAAPTPNDPLQLLHAVEGMLDRRDARLRESLQPTGPKESVLDAVKIGLDMARAAAPDKGSDKSFDLMMAQLNALRDENRDMTKRYLDLLTTQATAANVPPKSTTEQLEETARLIEAVERIRPRRGAVVQEEHPILDAVTDLLKPIIEQAAPIIATVVQHGMTQTAQQPPPRPAGQPRAPGTPAPEPAPAQPALQPGGTIDVKTKHPIPPVVQAHFLKAFEMMQPPHSWTGEQFGDWLNAGYPDAINALRQIGSDWAPPVAPVDAIIQIAQEIPVIWSMIGPVPGTEAKLRQFLTELVMWTPPEAQPDEPEQPEPNN